MTAEVEKYLASILLESSFLPKIEIWGGERSMITKRNAVPNYFSEPICVSSGLLTSIFALWISAAMSPSDVLLKQDVRKPIKYARYLEQFATAKTVVTADGNSCCKCPRRHPGLSNNQLTADRGPSDALAEKLMFANNAKFELPRKEGRFVSFPRVFSRFLWKSTSSISSREISKSNEECSCEPKGSFRSAGLVCSIWRGTSSMWALEEDRTGRTCDRHERAPHHQLPRARWRGPIRLAALSFYSIHGPAGTMSRFSMIILSGQCRSASVLRVSEKVLPTHSGQFGRNRWTKVGSELRNAAHRMMFWIV